MYEVEMLLCFLGLLPFLATPAEVQHSGPIVGSTLTIPNSRRLLHSGFVNVDGTREGE